MFVITNPKRPNMYSDKVIVFAFDLYADIFMLIDALVEYILHQMIVFLYPAC